MPDLKRKLLWVDGVNSVVMASMQLRITPEAIPVHCNLKKSVDPDSHRFIDDAEKWFGKEIIRISSPHYSDIDDVFERHKWLSGPKGARCTGALKFAPRMDFELPSDTHFWGYTSDRLDAKRARRMLKDYPLLAQRSPLIEMGLTKADTHAILADAGIRRPIVYDLGLPNGNCIGCVKSSSPGYWALIRFFYPEVFARRCDQARRFGARLVIIGQRKGANGKRVNIRIFPDEIPADWPLKISPKDTGGCGFHCNKA